MADSDLSGTVLDGRYQVIEPIAEGAMGSVYRGERLKLGRAVAIKIMHQELPDELSSRQRFEREAKLMALLEHPNCVSVIDFGVHDDKPFLVMDLVRGTSLLDVIEKTSRLDVGKAADIIRQVLSGLAHAHELGIVHRDIKPANIMISEKAGLGQQVRILDFGLARLTESSTKLTTGIVVGTPNYMAPEQCKGGDIDARTDLYACGVLLFEMLTGRKPFLADDPIQVVRKHLLEAPPTMASINSSIDYGELEKVVAKALAKKPDDRFESAVAMSKAVEAAAAKAAAQVYARAVPDRAAVPAGNQQATTSGWSVPAGDSGPAAAQSEPAPGPVSALAAAAFPGPAPGAFAAVPAAVPAAAAVPAPAPAPAPVPVPAPAPVAEQTPAPPPPRPPTSSGAPDASLAIPPTRPASVPAADRPIPQLPFTKKQLMIAGAALVGLIVIIAIAAGGSKSKKSTATSSGGKPKPVFVPDEPKADPVPAILERANQLIAGDEIEDAVSLLSKARKANPDNAQLALALGRAYFGQLWWSEGVRSFRDAVRLDPELRTDPEMLKALLKGFLTTPDVDDRIADFMLEIGDPIKPYLQETADTHPNKQLAGRARAELRRYK